MITSIIVSVCALGLTAYGLFATRRHNRLSVTPHLSGNRKKEATNDGLALSYVLISDGLGPARIKKFTVLRNDNPVERGKGDYVETAIREQLSDKLKYQIKNTTSPGHATAIRAGESYTIGEVFFPGAQSTDEERIISYFQGLEFRIEYESFYGEKFVFDTRD